MTKNNQKTDYMMKCNWCKSIKKKMTIWWNAKTGELLTLCFMGCQHFPEPYKKTQAGSDNNWIRIDPWIKKRPQPKLRKVTGFAFK